MMRKEKIELYQVRDFGDRVNICFEFIKQNGKQIGRNFLRLLPFLVIASLINAYLQSSVQSNQYSEDFSGIASRSLFSFLITISILVILYIASLFVFSFVAEYEESEDGTVVDSKVWDRVKDAFWGALGGSVLVGLAVIIGFAFCVIPGIWLGVSFSLFLIVYIVERKQEVASSVTSCIGESYDLVKSRWFPSFGYLLVMAIIGYVLSGALSLPSVFLSILLPFFPDGSIITILIMIIVYAFVYVLSYIGSLLSSTLVSVGTSLLYFDLKENAEGVSLQKKIDNIGQSEL